MNTSEPSRRRSHRTPTFLRGKIVYGNGAFTLDCTVRDLTYLGARVQYSTAVTPAASFDLVVPRWIVPRACRIVWSRAGQAGIEFVGAQEEPRPPAAPGFDVMARVTQLEAENAALRAEVERLRREARPERSDEARFA